jgi:predicted acetyltransferase
MTHRSHLDIGPARPDEIDELNGVLSAALHLGPEWMRGWLDELGVEHFRAVRQDGRIVGGLGFVMMGQWFGGQRVPLAGVTAVGVVPEARGSGAGSALLRAALEELNGQGTPLAALYPATLPFYRRGGFERAGQRLTYEMPIESIDVRDLALDLVPFDAGDYAEIERAYERRARRSAGNLDRPAFLWRNALEPRNKQPFRYRAVRDGQTEGYICFTQGGRDEPLTVLDVCVLTPAAGRRLLTLLGGYRSMVEKIVWSGGPLDPFLYLIGENLAAGRRSRANVLRGFDWMLRLVDVPAALNARGYPPGLGAELHLDVRDEVLPDNNRRFILDVADGRATAREGGQGRIRLHVRDLAALYSGFMAPSDLCALGSIDGPEEDLALAGAVFAGPRPWIADMF